MGGIGEDLRAAREARGVSLEDVQRELHIRERYLQALENDAFEDLPGDVYTRGFLRSYARYLGLDPAELIDRLPRPAAPLRAQPAEEEPSRRRERHPQISGRTGSQWPWVVIPLVFLVALLYFVGSHPQLFGSSTPTQPSNPPSTGQKTHGTGKAKTPPKKQHTGKPKQQVTLQPAAATQGPYSGPQANYTVTKGPITVMLQLTAPCYVYLVMDGAATPQTETVEPPGTLQYTAQQSFVVKLGVPTAATLKVDGQVVQLQGSQPQSVGVAVYSSGG